MSADFLTEDELFEARIRAPVPFKILKDRRGKFKGIGYDEETRVLQRQAIERCTEIMAAEPKRRYRAEFAAFDRG